ncbi:cytochrome o ubiquinol oxidase subunit I [Piscirickettsia litoralis]|uniref:Cytochrome bo(3) ubiquinol oxidase subunit 1 n=1 Tax=Piscirickettsia litoralis TaxID=1891921 RepID=A0ABX3A454_9GAMM|nr:cytochrome o ubiquinol oxidase subunit I [Piscirickettsia litoralis]ODN43027.1 cytochrome o ubiquinol oxidase subunit I [Piscirickettsia litoralis]
MLETLLLGRLTLQSIPYDNPIIMGAGTFMAIVVLAVLGSLTYFKKWKWLWKEWLTSVDHKKIGIMYIILAFVMLLRGFSDAIMMRLQQALAYGHHLGYLPPEHYDQVFTAHGVIMIFFMAMAFVFGLVNIIVPLQIGARDVAYPYLNSLSFWLTTAGALLVNISLVVGKFAATGWLAYPPLSELAYSPGVGVDYYLWALSISGVGTLIGAINIFVTIIKMRCPGMSLMKMPIFTWSVFSSMILVIISFPILNITLLLLFFDRFFGTHFFTSDFGGNAMLYINLIWTWGHPEVYILVLPAFGIFSEIIATFSKKPIFGYAAMVWATFVIAFLAFTVWLHHFFTMGAGADVNSFFGIATMIISIPTGVKIFNWLATMYRGKITFSVPMMWSIGFLITFSVGGMTGVLMAVPGVDFQFHNSLFLVAHFHNTIIGGVAFGLFAGYNYWFPKLFGFTLNERLGKCSFWCWFIGFYLAFMPLYILGIMGMTRRLNHYTDTAWHIYLVVAAIGAAVILLGIIFQILQLVVSIKQRHENRDLTGDPWDARTLEWSIPSPAPFYNFAITPEVDSRDSFWEDKEKQRKSGKKPAKPVYSDIHMPKNTSIGFIIGILSLIFGFAMVWEIVWLYSISGIAILAFALARTFNFNIDYYVKAKDVEATEAKYLSGATS